MLLGMAMPNPLAVHDLPEMLRLGAGRRLQQSRQAGHRCCPRNPEMRIPLPQGPVLGDIRQRALL